MLVGLPVATTGQESLRRLIFSVFMCVQVLKIRENGGSQNPWKGANKLILALRCFMPCPRFYSFTSTRDGKAQDLFLNAYHSLVESIYVFHKNAFYSYLPWYHFYPLTLSWGITWNAAQRLAGLVQPLMHYSWLLEALMLRGSCVSELQSLMSRDFLS